MGTRCRTECFSEDRRRRSKQCPPGPSPLPLAPGNDLQIPLLLDHIPPLLHPGGLTLLFMGECSSLSPGSLPTLLGFQGIGALLAERGSGLG